MSKEYGVCTQWNLIQQQNIHHFLEKMETKAIILDTITVDPRYYVGI